MSDLYSAKAGDILCYENNRYGVNQKIFYQVERITPMTVICRNNKFRKSDGYKIGQGDKNSFMPTVYARMSSEKEYADYKDIQNLTQIIKGIDCKKLSIEQMRKIAEVLV